MQQWSVRAELRTDWLRMWRIAEVGQAPAAPVGQQTEAASNFKEARIATERRGGRSHKDVGLSIARCIEPEPVLLCRSPADAVGISTQGKRKRIVIVTEAREREQAKVALERGGLVDRTEFACLCDIIRLDGRKHGQAGCKQWSKTRFLNLSLGARNRFEVAAIHCSIYEARKDHLVVGPPAA